MQRIMAKFLSVITMCFFSVSVAAAAGNPCFDVGVGGTCQLFADAVVQDEAARGLIKVAMKSDVRDAQSDYYELMGNLTKSAADNHYIYLDSDGKSHVFEFKSFDLPAGAVDRERTSVRTAICKMYGGQSAADSGVCYMNTELSGVQSAHLWNDLKQFGMYPEWVPEKEQQVVGNQKTVVRAHYRFVSEFDADDFDADDWTFSYNGHEVINPNVFADLQIKDLISVKDYLADYTILRFAMSGLAVNNFSCASSTIKVRNGMLSLDDFLPCSVTYHDVDRNMNISVNIGFVFDDAADTKKKTVQAGSAMLACAASGGSASEKGVCAGFDEQMCELLRTKNGVDVEWNLDKGGCVLKAQEKYNSGQTIKNMTVATVGVAVGVLTIPATGGGSAMAVVAIIGGVATAIGMVTSVTANLIMDSRFSAALLGANKCLIAECGGIKHSVDPNVVQVVRPNSCACAREAVQGLAKAMVEYEGVFTEQDAETALFLIEALISADAGTLYPVCLREIADGADKSGWQNVAKIGDAVALVGVVLSVPTWFSHAASSAKTVGDTLTNKFNTSANNAQNVLKTVGQTTKITKIADKMRSTANTAVLGLERLLSKVSGTGKKLNEFTDRLLTADSGKNLVQVWADVCPSTTFPCDATLTKFVADFDNMCGVM